MSTGNESALVVPVPLAEPVVGSWRDRLDPSAARGVPAHVTVLYPFVPPDAIDDDVEARVAAVVGRFAAFPVRFAAIGRFPGVVYLEPDPAEPFVALTAAITSEWPSHPPYGGRFDTVVPHLTVAHGKEPRGLARELARSLPLDTTAEEVWLLEQHGTSGRWRTRARFGLKTP